MLSRNVKPAFARNPRFYVVIEPYSLARDCVGQQAGPQVHMSAHRSAAAARRAIIRLIRGTDNGLVEYQKARRRNGEQIACRLLAIETRFPFKRRTAADLAAIVAAKA